MIKLNFNNKVGDIVNIINIGWQMREANIARQYEIVGREYDDCNERYDYTLVSCDKEISIKLTDFALAYITGELMDSKPNTIYDGNKYQPFEEYNCEFEEDDEGEDGNIPFWYVGGLGFKNKFYSLHVDFNNSRWRVVEYRTWDDEDEYDDED